MMETKRTAVYSMAGTGGRDWKPPGSDVLLIGRSAQVLDAAGQVDFQLRRGFGADRYRQNMSAATVAE